VKKLKEMNEGDLKTQCRRLHIALFDADSHDSSSIDILFEIRALQEVVP
jgi:hypothetical protein